MSQSGEMLLDPRSVDDLRKRATRLESRREQHLERAGWAARMAKELEGHLARAPKIEKALEELQHQLFTELTRTLQEKLTIALQEVLEQPLVFKATTDFRSNRLQIDFSLERSGQPEDIMRGQGGSVANVLSVGLRVFALATLDRTSHRPFLVLDEQDCWLRPDIVPRLVKIIHDAGEALGLQVLMISHHDVAAFRQYADRIYAFRPTREGSVEVVRIAEEVQITD